jgi:predicted helicase
MAGMNKDNIGIILGRQSKEDFATLLTNCVCTHKIVTVFDRSFIFPLYVYPEPNDLLGETTRSPNFNQAIVLQIATGLGLKFTTEKTNDANTLAPIDLLDYIYAVLHSPTYRETYKEFLKIDFPRVPYPADVKQFWQAVTLGGELRQIHLFENTTVNDFITGYPVSGSNIVGKLRYEDGRVYINETQYFEGVPQLAWEFYIGGYQPAQKWLKDRRDRALSFEDILHYQKIIKALVETDRLMREIDKVLIV